MAEERTLTEQEVADALNEVRRAFERRMVDYEVYLKAYEFDASAIDDGDIDFVEDFDNYITGGE